MTGTKANRTACGRVVNAQRIGKSGGQTTRARHSNGVEMTNEIVLNTMTVQEAARSFALYREGGMTRTAVSPASRPEHAPHVHPFSTLSRVVAH